MATETAGLATLLDKKGLANVFKCSMSTLDKMMSERRVPRPIRIGGVGAPRWHADEIRRWLAAGAPSRDEWETT